MALQRLWWFLEEGLHRHIIVLPKLLLYQSSEEAKFEENSGDEFSNGIFIDSNLHYQKLEAGKMDAFINLTSFPVKL